MTVAQYFTPRGTVIQGHGLEPDVPSKGQGNAYVNMVKASVLGTGGDVGLLDLPAIRAAANACSPP
jgi:hypothetical protein